MDFSIPLANLNAFFAPRRSLSLLPSRFAPAGRAGPEGRHSSGIRPSVETVTTCHGINRPLFCSAVFAACSSRAALTALGCHRHIAGNEERSHFCGDLGRVSALAAIFAQVFIFYIGFVAVRAFLTTK